jgi:PAS domain S-box-containing protein
MDKNSRWLVVCIVILLIGSIITYEEVDRKDASMRGNLLANTKVAATAVNVSDIKALNGSMDDLNSSHYQNLKALMSEQRAALPSARFVYLLGQHDDGTIFFFVDSEPADSPDNSPPGQIYVISSLTIDNAFQGRADSGGPLNDQWGIWMSGMVPIFDPDTGKVVAVLGMDISGNDWTQQKIESGLVPGLTTALILTLVAIFLILQKRRREENQKLSEAAEALRESSEKYRTLIENSQDAVFIFQEGQLVFVSPAIKRILGYTPDEIQARPVLEFISPADRARVQEQVLMPKDRRANIQVDRVRLLRKDVPKEALATLNISYIDYRGRPANMGTLHDLTATESAEMALGEANRKLQLMTGITRHDILNQIMVLRGNLVLAKNAKSPAAAQALESRALEAAANIENMIAFTKDYQEIGMNAPSWHDLTILVRKSAASMVNTGLDLQEDLLKVELLADPLIVKVFHNLIDNTMRHGQRTTRIEFSAKVEDGSLLIAIKDDGIGIDAQDKDRIFDRGFGKHTGMGLFFSREVLSITGITINEVGVPGQGAMFVIKVPGGKWRPSI